jgi:response regulator of citrate/malate metabolism
MRKVLIIEDEAIISFGYRLQIERLGFEVIGVARSSEEAEELIAAERPDLMIMDVYLKGPKTGLELAQEIHQKDPIPVIFLTASTKPEVVEAILALKDSQYLAKPISSDGLSDVLERFLRDHVER